MEYARWLREMQRQAAAADDTAIDTMKRYGSAAALLISGKHGRDMQAPEPRVQVGFEPDEEEMKLLVAAAEAEGRDLIHIGCHADGSGRPTGMIAVVFFDGGKPRPHRRAGLVCRADSTRPILSGVSDEEDERCHFLLRDHAKMIRVIGYPVHDLAAGIDRAGELWHGIAQSRSLRDCAGETLVTFPSVPHPTGRLRARIK